VRVAVQRGCVQAGPEHACSAGPSPPSAGAHAGHTHTRAGRWSPCTHQPVGALLALHDCAGKGEGGGRGEGMGTRACGRERGGDAHRRCEHVRARMRACVRAWHHALAVLKSLPLVPGSCFTSLGGGAEGLRREGGDPQGRMGPSRARRAPPAHAHTHSRTRTSTRIHAPTPAHARSRRVACTHACMQAPMQRKSVPRAHARDSHPAPASAIVGCVCCRCAWGSRLNPIKVTSQ